MQSLLQTMLLQIEMPVKMNNEKRKIGLNPFYYYITIFQYSVSTT